MLESIGCLQQPRRHFRVILLVLSFTLMVKQTQSVGPLGVQDQPQNCSWDPLTRRSRISSDESNWRAFMSKTASTDEADWRDAMSKATMGTVVEIGLLGEDGSISEVFFYESKDEMELVSPEVENTVAGSDSRLIVPQEKIKDVIPSCKENMQDILLPERGTQPCLVTVPSHYIRQYKWPLSQLKVTNWQLHLHIFQMHFYISARNFCR